MRQVLFPLLFLLVILSTTIESQQIVTKDDVVFLVEIGINEQEIISHIKASGVTFNLSKEDINQLRARGVSSTVLSAMGVVSEIACDEIIRLWEEKVSQEKILEIIQKAPDIPLYTVEDWLKLRRIGVSLPIIHALQTKSKKEPVETPASVSIQDILRWQQEQLSAEDMIKRLQEKELAAAEIHPGTFLKLKEAGVPLKVVRYLAEKYLGKSENAVEEEVKDSDLPVESNPAATAPKTEEKKATPDNTLQIYPGCEHIMADNVATGPFHTSIKRSFYCTLFSCPGSIEEVESFYRSQYRGIAISKIQYLDVFRVLKMKFSLTGTENQVEVALYVSTIEPSSPIWEAKQTEIKEELQEKEKPLRKIDHEMEQLKKFYQQEKISREYLDRHTRELQSQRNIVANSRSYWDLLALEKLTTTKKNVLLVLQDSAQQDANNESTSEKIAKVPTQKISPKTLAKDIPALIYPGSSLVEHHKIEEGLRRTSKKRSVFRTLFICPGTAEQVESYYRAYQKKISVVKVSAFGSFRIVKLKFDVAEINSQVEIALFSLTIGPQSPLWNLRSKELQSRLDEMEGPVKNIDHEITALQNFYKEGKINQDVLDARLEQLHKSRYALVNTASFWDITAMNKTLNIRRNILLLTQVRKTGRD